MLTIKEKFNEQGHLSHVLHSFSCLFYLPFMDLTLRTKRVGPYQIITGLKLIYAFKYMARYLVDSYKFIEK